MDKECDEDEEISSFAMKRMVITHAYNSNFCLNIYKTSGTYIILEAVSRFMLARRVIMEELSHWVRPF